MIDNNVLGLVFGVVVGMLLGLFYYGGLWLTVRRLHTLARPGVWLFLSLVVRIAVVVAILLILFPGHWERLVAALVGMFVARIALVRSLGGLAPGGKAK
jgi:F1F0 ATPase subunit 2